MTHDTHHRSRAGILVAMMNLSAGEVLHDTHRRHASAVCALQGGQHAGAPVGARAVHDVHVVSGANDQQRYG